MKKVFYITLFLSFGFCSLSTAQERIITKRTSEYTPKKGDYIQDLNASNFYGVWKWKDSNKEFILNIRKIKKIFEKAELSMDAAQVEYVYSENGIVISRSSSKESLGFSEDNKKLSITFYDEKLGKTGTAYLKINPDNELSAEWYLRGLEGLKMNDYKKGFSVPTDITLTKIE